MTRAKSARAAAKAKAAKGAVEKGKAEAQAAVKAAAAAAAAVAKAPKAPPASVAKAKKDKDGGASARDALEQALKAAQADAAAATASAAAAAAAASELAAKLAAMQKDTSADGTCAYADEHKRVCGEKLVRTKCTSETCEWRGFPQAGGQLVDDAQDDDKKRKKRAKSHKHGKRARKEKSDTESSSDSSSSSSSSDDLTKGASRPRGGGGSAFQRKLDGWAAMRYVKRAAKLDASAKNDARAKLTASLDTQDCAVGTSAANTALGGALVKKLYARLPDWDIWDVQEGPLGEVQRLAPEDPHALAGAAGAWEDAAVIAFMARGGALATLMGGLQDSVLMAALRGAETGLATVGGTGRPRAVCVMDAPLATYSAAQVAACVDKAAVVAVRMAEEASASARTVAPVTASGHTNAWAALAQLGRLDAASIGSRFSWLCAAIAEESAHAPPVGRVAQILLLAAAMGLGLALAPTKAAIGMPSDVVEAIALRAAADTRVAGATKSDELRTAAILKKAWATTTTTVLLPTGRDHTARDSSHDESSKDEGGSGESDARPKPAAADGSGTTKMTRNQRRNERRNKMKRAMAAPTEAPKPSKPPAEPAMTDALVVYTGKGGAPDLPADQQRDAKGRRRCRFFAHNGKCGKGDRCDWSHGPADTTRGARV